MFFNAFWCFWGLFSAFYAFLHLWNLNLKKKFKSDLMASFILLLQFACETNLPYMKFLNYFVFFEVTVTFHKVFFNLETDTWVERTWEILS